MSEVEVSHHNAHASTVRDPRLERIPIEKGREVWLLPVAQVASIIAEGELLHLSTIDGQHHTITLRLKDLEARLDAGQFVQVARGALVNIDAVVKLHALDKGMQVVVLSNGDEIRASRLGARNFRKRFLKL
jgi:DNA-binding LytR/AlgR family response regulator